MAKTKYKYVTQKKYLGRYKITYYCPCIRCCGVGGGRVTASGTKPKVGRTISVNPKVIPYGSKVKIGKKTYVAEDTGGGIRTNQIDVFVSSHEKALQLGVKYKKVYLVRKVKKKVKVKNK